ncbi:MAG: GNAT family N-acetyltransferase [Treponema sp.]|nr:GNAT family N-acetyltransferase [Treponema sp.]
MINIIKAQFEDLETILQLQYAAYQSEAILCNDFTIQPLKQTLDQVIDEYRKGVILKAVLKTSSPGRTRDEKIIGSVRAHEKENTVYIGKLMVHPDYQGNGVGRRLLAAIENEFPKKRCELYTACKSSRNLYLYETSGYKRFREETDNAGIKFIYFEKTRL